MTPRSRDGAIAKSGSSPAPTTNTTRDWATLDSALLHQGYGGQHRFIAAGVLLLALAALSAAQQTAAEPTELSLQRLEDQVQDLAGRIEALERGTLASPAKGTAPSNIDGPTWTFEPPLDGTKMSVIHYVLDTKTGIMELLLRIETPLEDKATWSQSGSDTPIIALVEDGEGSTTRATFRLLRGQRLDPGASLHLQARIPVATASKAGHVRIRSAPGG